MMLSVWGSGCPYLGSMEEQDLEQDPDQASRQTSASGAITRIAYKKQEGKTFVTKMTLSV